MSNPHQHRYRDMINGIAENMSGHRPHSDGSVFDHAFRQVSAEVSWIVMAHPQATGAMPLYDIHTVDTELDWRVSTVERIEGARLATVIRDQHTSIARDVAETYVGSPA